MMWYGYCICWPHIPWPKASSMYPTVPAPPTLFKFIAQLRFFRWRKPSSRSSRRLLIPLSLTPSLLRPKPRPRGNPKGRPPEPFWGECWQWAGVPDGENKRWHDLAKMISTSLNLNAKSGRAVHHVTNTSMQCMQLCTLIRRGFVKTIFGAQLLIKCPINMQLFQCHILGGEHILFVQWLGLLA